MSGRPAWVVAGAEVAEVVLSRDSGASGIHLRRIAAVAGGWIRLTNGNRYRSSTLEAATTNDGPGRHAVLRPLDDPEVQRSLALKELDGISMVVGQARMRGAESAADVLTVLDRLDQAVADARRNIVARAAD